MSGFKYHRDNQHRYNIYEDHIQEKEKENFYETFHSTPFYIVLVLILTITSLTSFNIYQGSLDNSSNILLINKSEQNHVKNEITQLELTQAISNSIIKQIDNDNSFDRIPNYQLKLIIKNVMDKIEQSSSHIIYNKE